MARKRTHDEIEKIVGDLGYVLLDEYFSESGGRRMIVIQDNVGYRWEGCLSDLIASKGGIGIFHVKNIKTIENISLWLSINKPDVELFGNNNYKGLEEKLTFFHNVPECKEVFRMSWSCIYHKGQSCSVCSGQQVGKRTSLAYLRPDLVEEWHPDNELSPEEFSLMSNERIYWICSICNYGENGEWKTSISNRSQGRGCPACSNPPKVVTDRNRLSILFPEIASEWHPTKNNELTPYNVFYGSKRRVWWLCPEGHEYISSINSRTNVKSCCKKCSDKRKESLVATELKEYFLQNYKAKDEYPICINPETGQYLPYDIYLFGGENPEINGVYIEVNDRQHYEFIPFWHRTTNQFEYNKELDKLKKNFAKKNGIYIEIDLRKIKTTKEAIEYIEGILETL
jgi:hypothetical protein